MPILDGPNAGTQGAPGAQVFPGFRPGDATDESRHNVAGYIDVEAQLVQKLLVGVAGRVENYNDFGSTTDGKVTAGSSPFLVSRYVAPSRPASRPRPWPIILFGHVHQLHQRGAVR